MTHRSLARQFRSGSRRWLVAAAGVALLGTLLPARTLVRDAFGQRRPQEAVTSPAISGYEVLSHGSDVAAGNSGVVERACTTGKRPLGGGFWFPGGSIVDDPGNIHVKESSPRTTAAGTTGWRVEVWNRTKSTQRIEVWVICATVSP